MLKENSSLASKSTHYFLAIYLGESYAEFEIRPDDGTEISLAAPVFHKSYFLPQTSLKSILSQQIKPALEKLAQTLPTLSDSKTEPLIEESPQVKSVYIVSKYLDRLKSFRLGGSVIQVLDQGHENNYTFEDSENTSLAALALVISLSNPYSISDLENQFTKTQKINSDSNKVVISLKSASAEKIKEISDFFTSKGFSVFINEQPDSMKELRKTLINAGSEGTKSEIIEEISEALHNPEIKFWINDDFKSEFQNIDLFFSADRFLLNVMRGTRHQILLHTDLERWVILKNKFNKIWQSPWGSIDYENISIEPVGIHPFSEVLINSSGHLSFSKIPAAIEPGPMLAGRSVKALVIDAFFEKIAENKVSSQLFPHLSPTGAVSGGSTGSTTGSSNLISKIESQFKVLEKGQIHYDDPFNLQIIQDFIVNKLGYDILLHKLKEDKMIWTGHLNFLFERLDKDMKPFSWTTEIFKRI